MSVSLSGRPGLPLSSGSMGGPVMPETPKEIEIKFRLAGARAAEAIRKRLAEVGARSGGATHEVDVYLDQPDERLAAGGRVLRLRRDGSCAVLTYKGPPAAGTIYSERDELEAPVADFQAMLAVLGALGYAPRRSKEKIRETFVFGEVVVCLDRLPFLGDYLEIEGPRRAIGRAAALLGLDLAAGTNRPYLELYQSYWRDRAVDPAAAPEMLFAAESKEK